MIKWIKTKINNAWNWTKNKARRFWKLAVTIVIGGVVLASMGGGEPPIPDKTFENLPSNEILEKRTENSKTHDLGGGKFSLDITGRAIHYKDNYNDPNEQWKDIDTNIQEINGKLVVNKAPYNLEIYKDKIGFKDVSKKGGWIEIVIKGNPDVSKRTIKGNQVIFEDAFPFIDIIVEAQNTRIVIWKKIKKEVPRQFKYEIKESKGERNPVILDRINSFDNESNEVKAKQSKKKISETADYEVFERVEDISSKAIKDGKKIDPVYPIMVDVIIDEKVSAGNDDADERGDDTNFTRGGTSLSMKAYPPPTWNYNTGIRFQNITVPNGSEITVAYLRVKPINTFFADPHVDIYLNDVDDALDFVDEADVNDRVRTTNSVSWIANEVGVDYVDTPDFANAVKEVVDRGGWASGQAMVVLLRGKLDQGSKSFTIFSFDSGDGSDSAWLYIEYTGAGEERRRSIQIQ